MRTSQETRPESKFDAIGSDGKTYEVVVHRTFTRVLYQDNTWSNEAAGNRLFSLKDGTRVYLMQDESYRIDGSNVALSKLA